ncbi:hypothetical protein C0J52_23366 [Blattella germanica]|nr:hypothetical protein C0J52_23366 [Blattella germanica]
MLKVISNIIAENYVRISNGIEKSKWSSQTNEVLQGDSLSPLLFNVLTHDVVEKMKMASKEISIFMYADDMAIASNNKEQLQKGFNVVVEWAERSELKVNYKKMELVVFRKGFRPARNDDIYCKGTPLKKAKTCRYLGITIQSTGTSYQKYVQEKAVAAIRAINDIKNLRLLSLETAIRRFNAKIEPMITYGIEVIWEHLTEKQLESIEGVKSRFLKRAMGLSEHTPCRLVYVMARENFLIEEIGWNHLLT